MGYKKPVFDEEDLGVNPFLRGLEIKVNIREDGDIYKKEDDVLINNKRVMEYTPYTKVYITPANRKIVNTLSDKAKSLYLWLMYEADTNKDFIWLNYKRYMIENEIKSYTTYANAIKELIRYGFVATTITKDVYWVNPDFFFRGSRVQTFPENVVVLTEPKD